MAGAGYKLFVNGNTLSASDLNTYVQQQTVMVFASAAARTTALSGVLAEGMISYRKDSHVVEVYNGSSWVSAGASSPLTTKGDLWGYNTADARVPVGTDGYLLYADSTQATGIKWAAAPTSGGMTLLSTTTLSGTSTAITGISQSYKNLSVFISGINFSSDDYLQIKVNGASNLVTYNSIRNTTAVSYANNYMIWFPSSDGNANTGNYANNAFSFVINNYSSTTSYKTFSGQGIQYYGGNGPYATFGGITTNSGISSLTITAYNGSSFNGGTVLIYGVS